MNNQVKTEEELSERAKKRQKTIIDEIDLQADEEMKKVKESTTIENALSSTAADNNEHVVQDEAPLPKLQQLNVSEIIKKYEQWRLLTLQDK